MDDDTDSSNWVLVDEIDCAEEAITLNPPPVTIVPAITDSDQESDASISIISDHPADSYSEEEIETPKKNDVIQKIMPIIKIDTEFETDINDDEIEAQVQKLESSKLSERTQDVSETSTRVVQEKPVAVVQEAPTVANQEPFKSIQESSNKVIPEQPSKMEQKPSADQISTEEAQESFTNHQTSDDDTPSTSTSESSSKKWTYADGKSKLELDTSKKTFFLDCSEEPILEVSANDTDVETESSTSTTASREVMTRESIPDTNIFDRDLMRERDRYINRVSVGFLISMLILTSSHLIRQYLDHSEDILHPPSPTNSFLDSIADNEKTRPIMDFCVNRQKSKGTEYSEHAVEKCVIKRLRKKNREDDIKKTEIYLQMKERVLELREKELVEKEREILKKWRKRMFKDDNVEEEKKRKVYDRDYREDKENIFKSSKEFNKKFKRNPDYNERKSNENNKEVNSEKKYKSWKSDAKDKIKTFRKKSSWIFESAREPINWNFKTHPQDDFKDNKKNKKNNKEEILNNIKDKVKDIQKDKSKQKYKDLKGDRKEDPNEEWYIKYNPVKNTIELVNITTLPEQDSELIRNGNKTINGQWYFSLYGTSRSNIRNKEKAAEWYFRRGNFREHKRDKAKWYFDYMSARDNTRYFY